MTPYPLFSVSLFFLLSVSVHAEQKELELLKVTVTSSSGLYFETSKERENVGLYQMCIKIPRCDVHEGGEIEVTLTSELHPQ